MATLLAAIALLVAHVRRIDSGSQVVAAPVSFADAYAQAASRTWMIGMTYGLASGGCWLATVIQARWKRWTVRAGSVLLLALVQSRLSASGGLAPLANLGGLVCAQCLLFAGLRIPDWSMVEPDSTAGGRPRRWQFGSGDLVIATTCAAILLAIAIRFPSPIDPLPYWLVLCVFWQVAPLIAYCTARGLLSRGLVDAGLWLGLAVLLAAGIAIVLAAAESRLSEVSEQTAWQSAALYARLMASHGMWFALFGIAARVQAEPARSAAAAS
jgi:hypothetical protein